MPDTAKVQELVSILNQKAAFLRNTPLVLCEEIKPNRIEKLECLTSEPLEKLLGKLMDGDITKSVSKKR